MRCQSGLESSRGSFSGDSGPGDSVDILLACYWLASSDHVMSDRMVRSNRPIHCQRYYPVWMRAVPEAGPIRRQHNLAQWINPDVDRVRQGESLETMASDSAWPCTHEAVAARSSFLAGQCQHASPRFALT